MQDGKALQAGTSHFLGQNFSKAQNILFTDKDKKEKYAWTTSWGVSTRMIGGLIMVHSDDDGLVMPPKISSVQIMILPIYRKEEEKQEVLEYINSLVSEISQLQFNGSSLSVEVDNREMRGGEKYWSNIKKGYPIILEVGQRDVKNDKVFLTRRDLGQKAKQGVDRSEFIKNASTLLDDIQLNMFNTAKKKMDESIIEISSKEEFEDVFSIKQFPMKLVLAYVADCPEVEKILNEKQLSFRCIPLDESFKDEVCIFTGKSVKRRILVGQSY